MLITLDTSCMLKGDFHYVNEVSQPSQESILYITRWFVQIRSTIYLDVLKLQYNLPIKMVHSILYDTTTLTLFMQVA